jgi:hypothetical protein
MRDSSIREVLTAFDVVTANNKKYEAAIQLFKEAADDFASSIERVLNITAETEMDPEDIEMLRLMRDVRDTAKRGEVEFEERIATP